MTGFSPLRLALGALRRGQVGTSPDVVRRLVRGLLRLAIGIEHSWRAVAVVGLVLTQELLGDLSVTFERCIWRYGP